MMRIRRLVVGAAAVLAACSPDYNWREVRAHDAGYQVLLPQRPAQSTREVRLGEVKASMAMRHAQVGQTTFAVAVAALPDATEATRSKAVAAMRTGMVRNIDGRETASRPVTVDVVDDAGRSRERLEATEIEAAGALNGAAATMLARFAAREARAYQWLVLGPAIDREQAAVFLESFKALR